MMKPLHILVVDDKKVIGDYFNLTLGHYGHHISVAHDLPQALDAVKKEGFDIAFMDMMMPGVNGVKVLEEIKALVPGLPVVMMSGFILDDMRTRAQSLGAVDFLKKPFEVDDIRRVVKNVIGHEI
ncbi:MAG: response regulator [Candidatus Omnitrophica bacterium]|nr:response regulator [Candidatus Omnitrophota bacterium]